MSSYSAIEADRVKTALQAGVTAHAFVINFDPERIASPLVDLTADPSALDELRVLISPRDLTRERIDRAGTQRRTLQIDIGVMQAVGDGVDPYDEGGE